MNATETKTKSALRTDTGIARYILSDATDPYGIDGMTRKDAIDELQARLPSSGWLRYFHHGYNDPSGGMGEWGAQAIIESASGGFTFVRVRGDWRNHFVGNGGATTSEWATSIESADYATREELRDVEEL